MKTDKQGALIHSFLLQCTDECAPIYREIIQYLGELGYHPHKDKANLSFKHDLHNKQIAKMGIRANKKNGPSPFFALRFSACRGYSQRFTDIVGAYIAQYPARGARCTSNGCNFCAGEADTHVYTYTFPNGEIQSHCGAYAVTIPGITIADIAEIKKLIQEEHEYLLKHEAGIAGADNKAPQPA